MDAAEELLDSSMEGGNLVKFYNVDNDNFDDEDLEVIDNLEEYISTEYNPKILIVFSIWLLEISQAVVQMAGQSIHGM